MSAANRGSKASICSAVTTLSRPKRVANQGMPAVKNWWPSRVLRRVRRSSRAWVMMRLSRVLSLSTRLNCLAHCSASRSSTSMAWARSGGSLASSGRQASSADSPTRMVMATVRSSPGGTSSWKLTQVPSTASGAGEKLMVSWRNTPSPPS